MPSDEKLHTTSGGNSVFHNYNNDFAHIQDIEERRKLALAQIDEARFGWAHVRTILIAGIGFFTDAYDIFAINMVTVMLGYVFWTDGKIPQTSDTAVKLATSAGTVVGQLGFGWLADVLGRKHVYGFELIFVIWATLAQALVGQSPGMEITGILTFWRVLMGIGIGGDYPLSSIITSEYASTKWRGAMMAAVFAMQGFGQLAAALMALIVTEAFSSETSPANAAAQCGPACRAAIDRMWRIVIGFGGVPGCIALYYRLTMPETPRYEFDVGGELEKCARSRSMDSAHEKAEERKENKPIWRDFWSVFGQWKHGKILLGTAGSWCFLDVAFYGLGLNNSIILKQIGYSGQSNVHEKLFNNAVGNIILICAGALPGYWLTVFTVDAIGRKTIQLIGFTILTILFTIIGFAFNNLSGTALLALYVLCQFFFNFGPNATTFILPGEVFPTRYRSTSHGISAASGKLGAIIAQALIGPLRTRGATEENESPCLDHVMQIFALFMFAGLLVSFLVPETKRKTLEQIVEEIYGERFGKEEGGGGELSGSVESGLSRMKKMGGKAINEDCCSGESSNTGSSTTVHDVDDEDSRIEAVENSF